MLSVLSPFILQKNTAVHDHLSMLPAMSPTIEAKGMEPLVTIHSGLKLFFSSLEVNGEGGMACFILSHFYKNLPIIPLRLSANSPKWEIHLIR